MEKHIFILTILLLPLILAPVSIGQESLILQDPQGDAVGFQVGPDAVESIDVVYVGIHSVEDGMAIIMKFAGEQLDTGTYAYRVSVQDQASDKMYELILVITGGSVVQGEYILQLPSGVITIPVTQDDVSIEGATITVMVKPARSGIPEVPLPTTDKSLQEVQLIVETAYTGENGIASDEANTFINLAGGGQAGETQQPATETQEAEEPGGYVPSQPFRDLDSKAPGVDVEVKGTPIIRLIDTTINGMPYSVIEIEVEGTSKGADHVGLVIEVFLNGMLDTQTIFNMETHPDSMLDVDGARNGYTRSIQSPLGPNAPMVYIEESLKPVKGWSEWSFKGVYKIPAVQLAQTIQMQELLKQIKDRNVEIYVTALAFGDPGETQYTTATKKAEIKLSKASPQEEPKPAETVTQTQEEQEGAGEETQGGIPAAALAAVAIVILAAAGIVLMKTR